MGINCFRRKLCSTKVLRRGRFWNRSWEVSLYDNVKSRQPVSPYCSHSKNPPQCLRTVFFRTISLLSPTPVVNQPSNHFHPTGSSTGYLVTLNRKIFRLAVSHLEGSRVDNRKKPSRSTIHLPIISRKSRSLAPEYTRIGLAVKFLLLCRAD